MTLDRTLVRRFWSEDKQTELALQELYEMVRTVATAASLVTSGGVGRAEEEQPIPPNTYMSFIFKRAATQPSRPTGSSPIGWTDGPPDPTIDHQPLWMSKTRVDADGIVLSAGVWSTPIQISGDAVLTVTLQTDSGQVFKNIGASDITVSPLIMFGTQEISAGDTVLAWLLDGGTPDGGASGTTLVVGQDEISGTGLVHVTITWSGLTAEDEITLVDVSDGFYKDVLFARSVGVPALDVNNPSPGGWSDGPGAAGTGGLWFTWAWKNPDGTFKTGEEWSAPIRADGDALEIQYSPTGTFGGEEHATWQSGDIYLRQKLTTGGWSAAIRFVGEDGEAFSVDETGLLADRPASPASGYAYYATDTGLLYFFVSTPMEMEDGNNWETEDGNNLETENDYWTNGVAFGKGDTGATGASGQHAWVLYANRALNLTIDPPPGSFHYEAANKTAEYVEAAASVWRDRLSSGLGPMVRFLSGSVEDGWEEPFQGITSRIPGWDQDNTYCPTPVFLEDGSPWETEDGNLVELEWTFPDQNKQWGASRNNGLDLANPTKHHCWPDYPWDFNWNDYFKIEMIMVIQSTPVGTQDIHWVDFPSQIRISIDGGSYYWDINVTFWITDGATTWSVTKTYTRPDRENFNRIVVEYDGTDCEVWQNGTSLGSQAIAGVGETLVVLDADPLEIPTFRLRNPFSSYNITTLMWVGFYSSGGSLMAEYRLTEEPTYWGSTIGGEFPSDPTREVQKVGEGPWDNSWPTEPFQIRGVTPVHAVITGSPGLVFRYDREGTVTPASITLSLEVYSGMTQLSYGGSDGYVVSWELDGVAASDAETLTLTDRDVSSQVLVKATVQAEGQTVVAEETVIDVTDGQAVEVMYSANGAGSPPDSNWHAIFQAGTDLFMAERVTGGFWSAAKRIVGETGAAGARGTSMFAAYHDQAIADGAPALPTPTWDYLAGNPGANGWTPLPPAGSTIWLSLKATDGLPAYDAQGVATGRTAAQKTAWEDDYWLDGIQLRGDQGEAGQDKGLFELSPQADPVYLDGTEYDKSYIVFDNPYASIFGWSDVVSAQFSARIVVTSESVWSGGWWKFWLKTRLTLNAELTSAGTAGEVRINRVLPVDGFLFSNTAYYIYWEGNDGWCRGYIADARLKLVVNL